VSAKENKELYIRAQPKIWDEGDMAAADAYFSPDVIVHGAPPGTPPGVEGVKQGIIAFRAGLPDLHLEMDDVIAEGDKVVCRYTLSGTHTGELMGIPASGKKVAMEGIGIVRFQDGRVAEFWGAADELGLMQQVGAIPAPAG
jgi:steroid delta-isomerase-like uncharacterized protein